MQRKSNSVLYDELPPEGSEVDLTNENLSTGGVVVDHGTAEGVEYATIRTTHKAIYVLKRDERGLVVHRTDDDTPTGEIERGVRLDPDDVTVDWSLPADEAATERELDPHPRRAGETDAEWYDRIARATLAYAVAVGDPRKAAWWDDVAPRARELDAFPLGED
ncbi:MAG: hypothetical protein ABEI75_05605 [Halobaculum sp.]